MNPSIEARLSTSQDSLTSTGSNHELKTQLDSTLKEVEAIAEHLEKQKKPSPLTKSTSASLAENDLPKPMIRRKTSEQINSQTLPSSNGARPRERVSLAALSSPPPDPAPRPSVGSTSASDISKPVMLKQSSWSSREQVNADSKSFSSSRNIWEKRSGNMTPSAESDIGSLRGGFRSNRDFWNQRVAIQQKAKQTPDLVLDLPSSTSTPLGLLKPKPRPRVSGSGKASDSMSSSTGSSSGEENLTAEQFANPDRNTLRKSSNSSVKNSEMTAEAARNENEQPQQTTNTPKRIPPVQARLLQQKKSPPE